MNEKTAQAPSDESPPKAPEIEKGSTEKEESPPPTQDTPKPKEKEPPKLAPSFFSKKETHQYLAQLLIQIEKEIEQEEREKEEKEKQKQ